MTFDGIQDGLKRISKQMQLEKNPDNILVMEASCELDNLKAQYGNIVKDLLMSIDNKQELKDRVIKQATEKCDNPVIDDVKYKIGYMDCTNDVLKLINEVLGE